MEENDPILIIIDAFAEYRIPYMLVGSYSSNLHGVARNTEDADFVVELGDLPISTIASKIVHQFRLEPQMGFETVTGHSRWIFHHKTSGFKVEMFLLVGDEFDQQRFARRERHQFCGRACWFQSAEDVIINKIRWARKKDIFDVVAVMKVQFERLDWAYIEKWCDAFSRTKILNRLKLEAQSPDSAEYEVD